VSFTTITLCVASQRVFIVVSVYFVMTQSGNFWIHPRILYWSSEATLLLYRSVNHEGRKPLISYVGYEAQRESLDWLLCF